MGDHEVINQMVRLQEKVHSAVLRLRAFERVIQSEEFETAYLAASDDLRNLLDPIIRHQNVDQLKDWVSKMSTVELELMSYRELRELCKRNHVYRWSRLDKDQMVEALRGIQLQSGQEST